MSEFLLAEAIKTALPSLCIKTEEPMSEHTSFRIGGAAEVFAMPADEQELSELLLLSRRLGAAVTVIGNGTNLLVSGEGVRGVVIRLGEGFCGAERTGENTVRAGAGISLAQLAVFARANSLTGLEFAHGIPGSLGGAVIMNAGAYGGEMKDVLKSVRSMTLSGEIKEYSRGELALSYRHSRFSDSGEIVISADVELKTGDADAIGEQMRALMAKRSASQPLDKPSAGSTFKRPATGYAAAMIDGAGLKGFGIGGAQVSEKHAGFVINRGGASFEDVLAVMEYVKCAVKEKYGVELEAEVKILR